MPWFNVGSGSRRAKPKRAQLFQQADRVVVEVFADLHEVRQLKSKPLPEISPDAVQSELSTACGNMIATTQARRGTSNASAQSPATQPAAPATVGRSPVAIGTILRASCGPDVQRLCTGARRESEVLKCLDSQRMELSTTCSLYFQNLGARAIQENARNKKPPSPPPTTPIQAQENAPNKKPQSPPTTPIPD
jgi:hypothetical protein